MPKQDRVVLTFILVTVASFLILDFRSDVKSGAASYHIVLEALVVLFTGFGLFWIWKKNSNLRIEVIGISTELAKSKIESENWRKENQTLVQGLGQAIEKQMSEWNFSPSEKEIALLLLKGLSFKEIADIRESSEKTVRQHSLKIYEKSKLSGRAELSAFFLEDILSPIQIKN